VRTAALLTVPKKKSNESQAVLYHTRGQKIMLSQHLARLYAVPVNVPNQAVKRNPDRFPPDFMFQLDPQEFALLKSQL
jgi:hypothetical protein